jgi:hypothetical protein
MYLLSRSFSRGARLALLVVTLCAVSQHAAAEQFSSHALRGMHRMNVAVEGVPTDFARYGLTANELRKQVEDRLTAAGLQVADDAAAQNDPAVGQLRVKLTAVTSTYGYYSYSVALQARRKIPLSADGGFVSQKVWSDGRSGVSNPNELRKIYPVVDELLSGFIGAQGSDNVAATGH